MNKKNTTIATFALLITILGQKTECMWERLFGLKVPAETLKQELGQPATKRDTQPNNFSWIDDNVAGMAKPYNAGMITYLASQDIALVISLTEDPLPDSFFSTSSITSLHVAIEDFKAPSLEQVNAIVNAIKETIARGKKVAIHCLGGRGRTGTILACWLIKKTDMTAHEAINTIREMRPGSIETCEQVKFIKQFALSQLKKE